MSVFKTPLALPAPEKVLLLPAPVEPQPEAEEAPVAIPEVKRVKRNNYKKLTNRKQGTTDEYGNTRKLRNLNNENKDDLVKALKWKEKIESGEYNANNLRPDQIIRIHTTWQELNNGVAPTSVAKLYNEMILDIK